MRAEERKFTEANEDFLARPGWYLYQICLLPDPLGHKAAWADAEYDRTRGKLEQRMTRSVSGLAASVSRMER